MGTKVSKGTLYYKFFPWINFSSMGTKVSKGILYYILQTFFKCAADYR